MLRTTLLLTAGLALLPSLASAQGDDCPLYKRLAETAVTETAAYTPKTETTSPIQISQTLETSAPRQIIAAPTPSLDVIAERGVDTSATAQTAPVKMAESRVEPEIPIMTSSPHSDWTAILQTYVSAPDAMGLTHFDYAGLKANAADTAKLKSYIESLEATDPATLSENEAIAFWANLYNAVTIQVVTKSYPIKSIKKLGAFGSGPWKKNLVTVNGTAMSLDDIEHGTLRQKFPSPYIHYMVNCASVGCPNLPDEAWEADTLKDKRIVAAEDFINSPRGAVVKGSDLIVSSIYDWFQVDFGGSKEGVLKHLEKHATGDLAEAFKGDLKIKKYDYDWSLNK